MSDNPVKISAVVTTLNSARTLEACLRSVAFAQETIVIDSGSTDTTQAIAQEHGATFLFREWEGYGQQKNFGMEQAQGQWIIFLDADEEISLELAQEIQTTLQNPTQPVYWLKIADNFLGSQLTHLYGHNPRLLQKGHASWNDSPVHEEVVLQDGQKVKLGDSHSAVLQHFVFHHSYDSIQAYLKKMHMYTTLDAKRTAETHTHRSGRKVSPWLGLPAALALRQWIKLLFYRRGILDGWAGIVWCTLSAYYEWELGRKYIALTKHRSL